MLLKILWRKNKDDKTQLFNNNEQIIITQSYAV